MMLILSATLFINQESKPTHHSSNSMLGFTVFYLPEVAHIIQPTSVQYGLVPLALQDLFRLGGASSRPAVNDNGGYECMGKK